MLALGELKWGRERISELAKFSGKSTMTQRVHPTFLLTTVLNCFILRHESGGRRRLEGGGEEITG